MDDSDGGRRIDAEMVEMMWEEMSRIYRTRRRRKRSSLLMHIFALVLAIFRIMPRRRFLDRFATTFCRTIYMPERKEDAARNLLWEVALCVHEHVHVRMWSVRFMWRYMTQKMWRAWYEAQAYRANIALRYWYAGDWLDIKDLAAKFGTNYGCGNAGVELAYLEFESERTALLQGRITCPVVKRALEFASERGVLPSENWPNMEL